MFFYLLLLFVLMPIIELSLLIRLAKAISLGPTLGIVILTGVVGAALARAQGVSTWNKVQHDLADGRMPTSEIVDALLIFIAGVVLITPGLITDVIGFTLLIPPARKILKAKLATHFQSRIVFMHPGVTDVYAGDDEFIDVQATSAHDVNPPPGHALHGDSR